MSQSTAKVRRHVLVVVVLELTVRAIMYIIDLACYLLPPFSLH